MKNHLHNLWHSRTSGEKAVMAIAMAVVAVLLYSWLVVSATQARSRLENRVTSLRARAIQLEQQSAEYARLHTTAAPTVAQIDLRSLVQSQTDAAGLSHALLKIDVQDAHRVQVAFGATSFAAWLDWVQTLQSQQVRIEACRMEALSTTGLVSITATLARSPSQ